MSKVRIIGTAMNNDGSGRLWDYYSDGRCVERVPPEAMARRARDGDIQRLCK